jgi:hypothetical protein
VIAPLLRATLGAAIALLVAAGSASARPGPDYYGVNVQPMVKLQVVPPDRWDGYVAQMAADGLRVARADALWAWAEPAKPVNGQHAYTWDPADRPAQSMDRIVALLARHGVRLLPTLTTAPAWAGGGGVAITPEHYADFAAFAGAFAARYGTGGSFWREHQDIAALPTTEYEVWTEANSANFWTHRPDPAEYARALGPVSAAIRQADPAGSVLASIGWQNFEAYLNDLYAAGARGSFDAIGFHPYAPHAVAILDLVERLRHLLAAQGDGALPIEVTETGQPRSTGAGSARAGEGTVSDEARAATHSLTGDALARSDCGVGEYLLYANVGSETDAERDSEGFMGLYSVSDGRPNATGRAIRDASLRWRAAPQSGLVRCSGGTTPASALLPLELGVVHDSPTCVTGHTAYHGNPLESAQLTLRTANGRVSRFETDAFGQGQVCIPDGPPIYAFDVTSEIANVAVSATLRCAVLGGACTVIKPAPGTFVAAPPRCAYALTARLTRVVRRRASVRAQLTCKGRRPAAARVSVLVQRRGHKTRHRLRRVTLRSGRALAFRVTVRLRPGDRLVVLHAKDRKSGIPRLEARATATRRAGTR